MPVPSPRPRTVLAVAGTTLLIRRAVRRRLRTSPLWPMPALEEPISGRGRRGSDRELLVAERTEEAEGVVRLRLEGEGLPGWKPGAHLDLVLPSGTMRQYSLCGDPADPAAYTIAVRLIEDGRGGSREAHQQLHVGTTVTVRGPRNRFELREYGAFLFIAGGIGITPILPMVRQAAAEGVPWRLLYCGRSRASMPFLEEIGKLDAGAGRVRIVAEDEEGRPDLATALADAPPGSAVYVCGPEGLRASVTELLPDGMELHVERFTPAEPGETGENTAFEVELARTGRTVSVPADQSVLTAIREQALPDLPYSCRQGFCGTCQQRVLSGEVDHRDELLTEGERDDSMLVCVSRALGDRLVLDV